MASPTDRRKLRIRFEELREDLREVLTKGGLSPDRPGLIKEMIDDSQPLDSQFMTWARQLAGPKSEAMVYELTVLLREMWELSSKTEKMRRKVRFADEEGPGSQESRASGEEGEGRKW